MKYYDKITPDGTKDLLFDECVLRSKVTQTLTEMFRSRGYRQVITPVIEFYDVFGKSAYFPPENMYKLMDNSGRLMVLRPDCTIPIARLMATRLKNIPMPVRLYYCHNVYRVSHDMRGKSNEIYQTGVELIGSSSLHSDLEIVELAASGLSEISGDKYRIELCHIGYFKSLIDSLDTDDDTKEEIRCNVEQKNYAALNDLLEQFNESPAATALKYLPRLFGGEEVFAKAYELFSSNGAADSLDYLRSIYESLRELGLADRVIIDLGLVNQAEYYTGIIFRGYFSGLGEPVLSGGRYDNLISDFGLPIPAIGFAFNVDLATEKSRGMALEGQAPDILVFSVEEKLPEAINYIKTLTQNGLTVENCVLDDYDQAVAYAKKRGISQIHVMDEEIEIIQLGEGQGR